MSENSNDNTPVQLYLVKLFPPCRIVWLYLEQNKIPYELIEIDCKDADENVLLPVDVCAHTTLPVLKDGSITVFECSAIILYLEKHKNASHISFGTDCGMQAKSWSFLNWAFSDLHRIVGYMYVYPQFFDKYRLENDDANEALIEQGIKQFTRELARLDKICLSNKPFLCGETITLADSAVASTLLQAQWTGFKFILWPNVRSWLINVIKQAHWDKVHESHLQLLDELAKQNDLISNK